MKPKLKKWLIRSGVVCISLFIIGYCFRDFWFGQLRIYALGLAEVRSDEFGYQLPDVDTIEVIALDGYAPESVPALETALGYRVHGRAELRGEDAERQCVVVTRPTNGSLEQ